MNLLAIDTFGALLSAAVLSNNDIHYMETDTEMKHSELVMEYIDTLMKKASLKPEQLNGVLCMKGPGSFTGLRIGYSIAKGLALSLSIPFAPVPTLDCVALENESDKNGILLAIIEARKNAYFYAFFEDGKRLTSDTDGELQDLITDIKTKQLETGKKIIIKGPGALRAFDSFPKDVQDNTILESERKGYAKEIITVAQKLKILDNDLNAYLHSGPDYIRRSDAEAELARRVK